MWTTGRTAQKRSYTAGADSGRVTLEGDPAGVYLGGERRWLPVYSPGGYYWKPAKDEQVAVLHMGTEQEAPCVVGRIQEEPEEELEAGEVLLSGGRARVKLGKYGLELKGTIYVDGKELKELIRELIRELL